MLLDPCLRRGDEEWFAQIPGSSEILMVLRGSRSLAPQDEGVIVVLLPSS